MSINRGLDTDIAIHTHTPYLLYPFIQASFAERLMIIIVTVHAVLNIGHELGTDTDVSCLTDLRLQEQTGKEREM